MFEMNWMKKAERLKMVLLSGGHQMAKELAPGLVRVLEVFERAAKTGDASNLQSEIEAVPTMTEADRPLWEPVDIHGWHLDATFYLKPGERSSDRKQLWWLVRAVNKNERIPDDKDLVWLDKILKHLGCDVKADAIIGPMNAPPGEERLPFGWWTWRNVAPLYEIQVNKDKKKDKDKIRIVRQGARESDGYTSMDLSKRADEIER